MHVIAWAVLIIALSSTPSTAQPVFLAGRYVLPITQHDLYVSAPGLKERLWPSIFVQADRKLYRYAGQHSGVPVAAGYNDTAINEVKATCNKTICAAASNSSALAPSSHTQCHFDVPLREIKASGGSFSGTYRYVSSSIARPRALLRRASVGNFEIVKNLRTRSLQRRVTLSDEQTRSVTFDDCAIHAPQDGAPSHPAS